MNRYLIIFLCLFLLPGCATISSWKESAALKAGYVQKAKLDTELSALRTEMTKKIDQTKTEISKAKDDLITGERAKEKKAANGFYGANLTFMTIPKPNRTDIITNNFVTEGWAALDNLMPDYQTMLDTNARLKRELDETQTSLEQLKQTHDQVVAENKVLVDGTKTMQTKLDGLNAQIDTIKSDYGARIDAKQVEINAKTNELLGREAARADDAKATQAMKEKVTMILGGFALAALAGAVWSPVFKGKFGALAAVLGFAAIGVWYITAAMVWSLFGIAAALIIGWAVYEHSLEKKAASATYAGLEDIKKTNPVLWAQIAPVMSEWQSRYVTKDGAVTTVPDPSISKHIDATLMATNLK